MRNYLTSTYLLYIELLIKFDKWTENKNAKHIRKRESVVLVLCNAFNE